MNPIERMKEAIAGLQPRHAYTMLDAVMLNVTLGFFQKAGISAAVLNVEDPENAFPVRFNASGAPGAAYQFWPCVQDGTIYFYFDEYEMVGAIVKTRKTRFLILQTECYTPLFLTPIGPVLTGPQSDDYDTALGWVEARCRRALEVLPSVLAS